MVAIGEDHESAADPRSARPQRPSRELRASGACGCRELWRCRLAALVSAALPAQQAKLLVTVFNEKTGEPITDLTAANFVVTDDKTPLDGR